MRPGLFAWLAGAKPDLLRESPGEAIRYGAMGTVLAGTAVMAAASATFALTTAVRLPLAAAIVVGVLWGALILSLDRMLVISMSLGKGFWRNLAAIVPRLGLALLIGSVISVPLVLRIFDSELTNELQVMHSENLIANQRKLDQRFADIAVAEARVEQLRRTASGQAALDVAGDPDVRAAQAEVDAAQAAYTKAAEHAQCELDGRCGSGVVGTGPAYQAAKAEADLARTRMDRANTVLREVTAAAGARISGGAEAARKAAEEELKTLEPRLRARLSARATAQRALDEREADNEGLLARLEALDRLSSGRPMMWTAHLALLALFTCIELLPVLAKVLSADKDSKYHQLLTLRESRALAAEQDRLDRQNDRERKRADAQEEIEADRLARQIEGGKQANARLAEKQEAITARAIDVWGEVAILRTDEELARWYRQHAGVTQLPQLPTQPVNGQQPSQA